MAARSLSPVLLLGTGFLWAQSIDPILQSIEACTPNESLRNGIETELRVALALHGSDPIRSAAYYNRARSRISTHPEVTLNRRMASLLFLLEPRGAEKLILETAKPAAFGLLLEHYLARNEPGPAVAILDKLLADSGPPYASLGLALEKLTPLDPANAVRIYFALRASPTLAAKYPSVVNRAPLIFSRELARAAAQHPDSVRGALTRLLPLFADPAFLADFRNPISMKVIVGRQELETKSARDTALIRLCALAKVLAPELLSQHAELFDARLSVIRTLDDALAIAAGKVQQVNPNPRGFDFSKANLDLVWSEWRKPMDVRPRLGAAGELLLRPDVPIPQKKKLVSEMVEAIPSAKKEERAYAADDLIWYAERARLDSSTIRPAVELLVRSIPDSPEFDVDNHTAATVKAHRIALGPRDASLRARIALLELEDSLSGLYSFTLPALDGGKVSLKNLRGQVVLLNFWATWCGPCRDEKPVLQKLYDDLKHKGLIVLAITDEEAPIVKRFVRESKIGLPILFDQARETFEHYGIQGLPKTIILNRQGRPVAWPLTAIDEAALRTALAAAGL